MKPTRLAGRRIREVRLRAPTHKERKGAWTKGGTAYEQRVRNVVSRWLALSPLRVVEFELWSEGHDKWLAREKEVDLVALGPDGTPVLVAEVTLGANRTRTKRQVSNAALLFATAGHPVRRAVVFGTLRPGCWDGAGAPEVVRQLDELSRLDWPFQEIAHVNDPCPPALLHPLRIRPSAPLIGPAREDAVPTPVPGVTLSAVSPLVLE